MTTLTTLIDRVHTAQKERDECDYDTDGAFEDTLEQARHALLQFVLAHAADIAERERLERAVVELHKALLVAQEQQRAAGAFDSLLVTLYAGQLSDAKDALIDYVIAHADDGAAT